MTPGTGVAVSGTDPRQLKPRIAWFASIVFCGVLPALTLVLLFASTVQDDAVAFDFRPFYSAAGAVLRGDSPYPALDDPLTASSGAYVYPPLPAIATIPFRALPLEVAGLVLMALLAATALAIPLVLGVRDWRCYGLVFLWPPVLSAIQTGNVTLFLGLAAALAWRFRDRTATSAACIGVTLAAKFFLWPLVVWLAATRRLVSSALGLRGRRCRVAPLLGSDRLCRLHRLRRSHATAPRLDRRRLVHGLHRRARPWHALDDRACGLARGRARTSRCRRIGRAAGRRAQRVHPRDRGCACANSNRVAALLRLVGRRRLRRATKTGDCLVHPAGDGRHAWERTSVAVRDFCDARSRGSDDRSRPSCLSRGRRTGEI